MPTDALTPRMIELLRSLPDRWVPVDDYGDVFAAFVGGPWVDLDGDAIGRSPAADALLATIDTLSDTRYQEGRRDALAEVAGAAEFAIDLCDAIASDDRIARVNVNYFTDADKAAERLRKILAATNPDTPEPEGEPMGRCEVCDRQFPEDDMHTGRSAVAWDESVTLCAGCNAGKKPPTDEPCETCNGNGRLEMLEHCPDCHGTGTRLSDQNQTNKEN